MSQVFSADSVNNTGGVTLTLNSVAAGVTGNFLNPPFGNAKAMVLATTRVIPGNGVTGINLQLVRNPQGDNTVIGSVIAATVTPGSNYILNISAADAIPDGRPVQYQLQVFQTAATGNGSVVYANICALLISG